MFLIITARFKNLRGQRGTLWACLCAAGFPALFFLPFVGISPVFWGIGSIALEIYIISTCYREWRIRTGMLEQDHARAQALRARAENSL